MPEPKYVLQETSDGCMVWEITEESYDKIDFYSTIYLAEQAYPTATRGPLPSFHRGEI